jgi:tetratricopeptide (TPR) repeat protein
MGLRVRLAESIFIDARHTFIETSDKIQANRSVSQGTSTANGIAPAKTPWDTANVSSFPLTETQEALIPAAVEQLLALPEESSRHVFLQQNPQFQHQTVVLYLANQVPKIARDDVDRALQMAGLASWLAEILNDDYGRARSARAMGHPLQLKGKHRESLVEYQKALDLFAKLKLDSEVAITLSGSLQPLILLGDYEESRLREEKARKIFKEQGDQLRLARLDANLGNILHRQDRFEEALVLYRRAELSLQRFDATDDLAIVLNNIAVCHISLHEFHSAHATYRRLRTYSEQRHLQLLTVQADYNIAYLHYLQGEYDRAIDLYEQTRTFCARAGDPYHAALCDLDQAEIYLDLRLFEQCAQLAKKSLAQFQGLKMNYEAAKAYTFLGLTACHQTDSLNALELFAKARELFLREQNWTWPALLDLYRAIVLYYAGSWPEALKSVTAAQSVLSHSALKDKAALAELLRSLLHLELGDSVTALYWGELALKRIERSEITRMRYLAEFVLGRVRESQNDLGGAQQHYERAKTALENPANHRKQQDMRVPLLKSTDSLYQHLISLALRLPGRNAQSTARH